MESNIRNNAPEGHNTLNPYIAAEDVGALVKFLQRTFGGVIQTLITLPDGGIAHAEVRVGDSLIMTGPPPIDRKHLSQRASTFYVFVPNVDIAYSQAMACGARAWAVPAERYNGDRVAAVTDTNGNAWWIAKRREALSVDQLQTRADRHWHKKSVAPGDATPARPAEGGDSPPPGYLTVNPYLSFNDALEFIKFVESTFDGILTEQIRQPDGRVEHAEIRIGNSVLMVGPPEVDALLREDNHERTGTFYVFVRNVDETCDKAIRAGAELVEPASRRFYGDRVAQIKDPYGNHWWIATREETLGQKELQERADEHWQVRTRAVGKTVPAAEVLEFMKNQRYGVQASINELGMPQAALVGFLVNEQFELFFDTFDTTRKAKNLRRDPNVAFVIGGHTQGDERTVQYEGIADIPMGSELETFKDAYFALHPDATRRSRLPGITYFRVRPRWVRYTNFNAAPPQIAYFQGAALKSAAPVHDTPQSASHSQTSAAWLPAMEHDPVFNAFAKPSR